MTAFPAYVIRGVEQTARDIGAAIKRLIPEQRLQLALHVRSIVTERQPDPRLPVEHHDGEAIVLAHGLERIMGRRRDALHVRPHASADVEQQENVDRHVFAGKIFDLAGLAFLAQNEVGYAQSANGAIRSVDHLGVYANQGDVAAEYHLVVTRDREEKSATNRKQQKANSTVHWLGYALTY